MGTLMSEAMPAREQGSQDGVTDPPPAMPTQIREQLKLEENRRRSAIST